MTMFYDECILTVSEISKNERHLPNHLTSPDFLVFLPRERNSGRHRTGEINLESRIKNQLYSS